MIKYVIKELRKAMSLIKYIVKFEFEQKWIFKNGDKYELGIFDKLMNFESWVTLIAHMISLHIIHEFTQFSLWYMLEN